MEPKLIVFDADGTLVNRQSGNWLPGVLDYLSLLRKARNRPFLALVTNQGGPACRDASIGATDIPSLREIELRYTEIARQMHQAHLYISLAYQLSTGEWLYPQNVSLDDPRLRHDWRKPQPGMLIQAMADCNVLPGQTLMIGDRPEDRDAAVAAGCYFQWAQKFFGRGWEPGKNYGLLR